MKVHMAGPLRVSGEINKPFPDLRGSGGHKRAWEDPVDIQKASLSSVYGSDPGKPSPSIPFEGGKWSVAVAQGAVAPRLLQSPPSQGWGVDETREKQADSEGGAGGEPKDPALPGILLAVSAAGCWMRRG